MKNEFFKVSDDVYENLALNFISTLGVDVNEIVCYEETEETSTTLYVEEMLTKFGKELVEKITALIERKRVYHRDKENQRHQLKDHTGALHASIMANICEDLLVTIAHNLKTQLL